MVNRGGKTAGNIAIIGFMATGKTSLARELASYLGLRSLDIDNLIEERENREISQIFKQDGEGYFRRLEKEIVKELSLLEGVVISCGGGVCLDPENIKNLRKKNKIVLLEASVEDILARTKRDKGRPLLNRLDKKEAVTRLMADRKDQYRDAADIIIDTSGKRIREVRDEIIKELGAGED